MEAPELAWASILRKTEPGCSVECFRRHGGQLGDHHALQDLGGLCKLVTVKGERSVHIPCV